MAHRKPDWLLCGYKDATERTVYQRSPSPNPPRLPDEYLPAEWREYLEGWRAGIQDGVAQTLRRVKQRTH